MICLCEAVSEGVQSFGSTLCTRTMEAHVEHLVSLVHRSADRFCHYCIFDLLIETSISYPIHVHLNMNIVSMDVFNCLYIVDYIC